jgi:hypothetical protein
LYFIIGSDSYSGAANLQISKKDLPKFFKMVRDAEAQVNSLPIDEVRTDSKIWNDGSALAKELEEKGIAIKAYVEGTSSGALGKTQLYVATDGMTRDEFKQAIEQNYKKHHLQHHFHLNIIIHLNINYISFSIVKVEIVDSIQV